MQVTGSIKVLASECPDIRLTRLQGDQSTVAGVSDGDNSLSMRWGTLSSAGYSSNADHAVGSFGAQL